MIIAGILCINAFFPFASGRLWAPNRKRNIDSFRTKRKTIAALLRAHICFMTDKSGACKAAERWMRNFHRDVGYSLNGTDYKKKIDFIGFCFRTFQVYLRTRSFYEPQLLAFHAIVTINDFRIFMKNSTNSYIAVCELWPISRSTESH